MMQFSEHKSANKKTFALHLNKGAILGVFATTRINEEPE